MDEDKLELLERQLSDKVTARVRPALFRVYATIGTTVIATLGFVSWDIVSDIKAEIKAEIRAEIDESIVADIKEKRKEIEGLIVESRILAKQANEVVLDLDKKIKDFEPQASQLDETILKVNSLNVDARNLVALYSTEVKPLVENFGKLSGQLQSLAQQVDQLNSIAGTETTSSEMNVDSSETRGNAISSVITETTQVNKQFRERNKTTVFFQFSSATKGQAEELSQVLKEKGYIVPAEDRETSAVGKHEVRFFHSEDEAEAKALAGDITDALKGLGYPESDNTKIITRSYVNYSAKKPRVGVIELWLDLPFLKSG